MEWNKTKNIKYKFKNIEFDILNGNVDFTSFVSRFIKKTRVRKGYLSVIVNIRQINGQYFSVGARFPLEVQNNESISAYIEYLQSKYLMLENRYKAVQPIAIIFNFTSTNKLKFEYSKSLLSGIDKASRELNNLNFKSEKPANLPLNTDYLTWGTVERQSSNNLIIKQTLLELPLNMHRFIHIYFSDKLNRVIEVYTSSNILLSKITDKLLNAFGNEFIRQIGDKFYHIKNRTIHFIFENVYLENKNITKARPATKFVMNMITLDIETFKNEDGTMSVYCVSIFDGKNSYSYFLSDFKSINDLMSALLKKIFCREYAQKTIYIHNSSNFDLIFLLKYIVNKEGILLEPIIKDGKYINLRIKYGPNFNYYVNFKDSYLILPGSLDKLTKNFNVETLKGSFPHDFVTSSNLDYIGPVPEYSYFKGTNLNYENYLIYTQNFHNNWHLKKAAIKYCEGDCIALYQTIMHFSNLIFNEFNINVSSVSTLPSLAFKVFRAKFLSNSAKLPVISGKIYSDISQAYFGGHCDMYIPSNPKGQLVYEYDCNSLYPHVMKECKYPGKLLGYFRGDITSMNE